MRSSAWAASLGVLAAVMIVTAAASDRNTSGTLGYLLFTPSDDQGPIASGVDSALRISACESTPEGLEVTGRVAGAGSGRHILVTPEEVHAPGQRVGNAFAADVPLWSGAVVGDFQVVLPWATPASRFTLLEEPPSDGVSADATPRLLGPAVACPPTPTP